MHCMRDHWLHQYCILVKGCWLQHASLFDATCCIFRSSVGIQVHCVSDLLFYDSGSVCRMHNASFFFLSLDGGVLLFSWWLGNIAYAALFDLRFFITCDFVSFLWVEPVSVILANTLRSNFKRTLCDLRYWGRIGFMNLAASGFTMFELGTTTNTTTTIEQTVTDKDTLYKDVPLRLS